MSRRTPPQIKADMRSLARPRTAARNRMEKARRALDSARVSNASPRAIAERETDYLEARGAVDAVARERRVLERELAGDWAPPAWEPDSAA